MPVVQEINGSIIEHPMGLSIYDVRFIPGTGWERLNDQIKGHLVAEGKIYDSYKPQYYELGVQLKPGLFLNRPFLASNMRTVTDVEMAGAMNNVGAAAVLHQFAPIETRVGWVRDLYDRKVDKTEYPHANTIDDDGTPPIFAAVGFDDAVNEAVALAEAGASGIIFDTENAYTPSFRKLVERGVGEIRSLPRGGVIFIGAGNIGTAWGAEELFNIGIDMPKVGIGAGVPCDTPEHGAHIPQLGAIHETWKVADQMGKGIIYDGGAKNPFAHTVALAYATLVMSGSYWAATRESAGMHFKRWGKEYVIYQGSASTQDREERRQEYSGKYQKLDYRPSEGRRGPLPVMGSVEKVLERTLRTVRLMMHYVGAYDIEKERFTYPAFREYSVLQRLSEEALRQLNKGGYLPNFQPRSSILQIFDLLFSRYKNS